MLFYIRDSTGGAVRSLHCIPALGDSSQMTFLTHHTKVPNRKEKKKSQQKHFSSEVIKRVNLHSHWQLSPSPSVKGMRRLARFLWSFFRILCMKKKKKSIWVMIRCEHTWFCAEDFFSHSFHQHEQSFLAHCHGWWTPYQATCNQRSI